MISNCLNDPRLVCFAKYVLGFKEGRRMGAKVHMTIRLQGKDLQILTLQRNVGTEWQDQ
ncbi:hypothetical protein DPMN_065371 [Dreissena polymorpha]|uniref:Uncharacterized protein n=1 Tax=Dreissena polymorpha TaxID=45954 RepID=A0A9D4CDY8_DREPO|nr:hypothetical protein DPMN_065371 [Dreissena polymorpha]